MLPKLAALHMSPCGPGCVKSRIGRKSVESFSLLSSATAVACTVRFQIRRNRDGSSKSKLNFRLFTQPGPQPDSCIAANTNPSITLPVFALFDHLVGEA